MNTWFRRAVGTVGVAGGMLLLGAGAAHADDTALAPGQLDDLFSPAGGPNNQSLSLHARGDRIDTSAASSVEAGKRTTSTSLSTNSLNSRKVPSVLRGLPLTSLVPTDSLGLPRTTSSRLPNLPPLPTDALATNALPANGQPPSLAATEDSLASLPLVGRLANLNQVGLPGTSIADTSTAFPAIPRPGTEALPVVGGLPLLGNGLPVRGTLKPVDDYAIPIGGSFAALPATEADGLPVVGDLPLGGSDVLRNDSVTGVPVIGGIGPTPGVSTTAVANRLVPTTGALPQAASQLPLVTEQAYAPKHATTYSPRHAQTEAQPEALPVLTGLPAVGGLAAGALPLFSGIVG
ncbi:hypothetical protein [Dactylosporangium sp. CA-092794]|uniref:hypothetical protein n=1 Tax=Dactylosporangium sp. CA-092794 TaxID=3239929 RepID=UPI003D8E3DC9